MNALQWDIAAWVAAGLGVCAAIGAAVIFVRWDMPRVGAILSGRAARREMEGFRLTHRENPVNRENPILRETLVHRESLGGRMSRDAVEAAKTARSIVEPDPTVISDGTVMPDRTLMSDQTLVSDRTLTSPARDPPDMPFAVSTANDAYAHLHPSISI